MTLLARNGRWHEAVAEGRWIIDEIFNPLTLHRWMQKRMEIREPVMSYARALAKAGLKHSQKKFLSAPAPKQVRNNEAYFSFIVPLLST